MPERITIDPTNIPKSKIPALISFFNETKKCLYPQGERYSHPDIGTFSFTDSMVAWFSHAVFPYTMHFEVFNEQHKLARGGQATVYTSKGTLSLGQDHLSFSNKCPRVIKVGPESHFSLVERELHQLNASFSCLPLTVVDETAYFIMEKVPGVTLEQFLKDNVLSVEQRFMLALEIINATCRIAKNDIHHRDIKPQNIMVHFPNRIPYVHIIDFGLAKFAKRPSSDTRQAECFEGTVAFAPPERYKNISTDSSDTYSVAVVLALIFGAVLRPCLPGWEAFLQGLKYSARMNYTNTLSVAGLSKTVLTQLESIFTKMSFIDADLRMNLAVARSELVEVGLSLEAGLHDMKVKAGLRSMPRSRVYSCWVRPNDERKSVRQSSSLFSLHSEDDPQEPHTEQPTTKPDPSCSVLSPTFLFFPAAAARSPGWKSEPNSLASSKVRHS